MCLFIIDKQVGCHDHKFDALGKSSCKLAETLKWVFAKAQILLNKIEPGQYMGITHFLFQNSFNITLCAPKTIHRNQSA
jgi:hypothetical protein